MITIVFVSNYFNHHEKFFCDEMNKLNDVNFHFIQTIKMDEERIKLGWNIDLMSIPYCINSYGNNNEYEIALKLCNDADVLILGSAPYKFVSDRVKKNKLTFYYAERLFRNGLSHLLYPPTFINVLKRFIIPGRKSNFYLLAASGYTAIDTSRIFAFNNHRFKWGHFIEVIPPNEHKYNDGRIHLLWVGRFIKLKHPDYPIRIAKTLKEKKVPFILDIIGTGNLEYNMRKLITEFQLNDYIKMRGAMKPSAVRSFMERSDIYLFTSDFNEGWGAVLGESMAAGCAVVTSHGIGATPFLINHEYNGLIYETGKYDSFERQVLRLVESKELVKKLSQNAINTMQNLWNPQIAAERFYELCKSIISKGKPIYFENGPISKAHIIKNNWYSDNV